MCVWIGLLGCRVVSCGVVGAIPGVCEVMVGKRGGGEQAAYYVYTHTHISKYTYIQTPTQTNTHTYMYIQRERARDSFCCYTCAPDVLPLVFGLGDERAAPLGHAHAGAVLLEAAAHLGRLAGVVLGVVCVLVGLDWLVIDPRAHPDTPNPPSPHSPTPSLTTHATQPTPPPTHK